MDKYPVLIVLHGGSEIGNDLNMLRNSTPHLLPAFLIEQGNWPASRPFIVVSPQLKRDPSIPRVNDQEWSMHGIDSVIEYVKDYMRVDTERIYLTGISLGAAGAWRYAATYPDKVAAIVPIGGKTVTSDASILKNIPVWAFHGEADGVVRPKFSVDMVNAINSGLPQGRFKARLNLLHTRAHEGWNEVYDGTNGYDIYNWLLQFTKSSMQNIPPQVNAGEDKKILLRNDAFHLYGEYFDTDGSITHVAWAQTSGPALTLDGTNARFLKITSLVPGDFVFRLTVTDNAGATRYDDVALQVLETRPSTVPAITGLILTNGGEAPIGELAEGQIISTSAMGTDLFNIKAVVTGSFRSVRFSVNSNQNTRTATTTDAGNFYIIRTASQWQMLNGEYIISATAFSGRAATGTPGITQSFKVTVTDKAVTVQDFYAKPDTDISKLSSWGKNADGSGVAPLAFDTPYQRFHIVGKNTVEQQFTISGAESSLSVKNGGQLTLNDGLGSAVHAEGNAVIHVNTDKSVRFDKLAPATTVNFNKEAVAIPAAEYGHIALHGGGSIKTLASGITMVVGTLEIDDDVVVNGVANTSVVKLYGDLFIAEKESFVAANPFELFAASGATQTLNIAAREATFLQLSIAPNTTVQLKGPELPMTMTVGHPGGGGILVEDGAQFLVASNIVSLKDHGTLNSGGQKGKLAFNRGGIKIHANGPQHSYLYLVSGMDSVDVLSLNLEGAGELFIKSTLYIVDSLKCNNGTVHADGWVALVSTPGKTARIAALTGTAKIMGDVEVQQCIAPGIERRYLSFPVKGIRIRDLQKFIPVTGTFQGASTGPGIPDTPSLYYYDEVAGGWMAYPVTSNEELLIPGRGYAVDVPKDGAIIKTRFTGTVLQQDFVLPLRASASGSQYEGGWNLVGNPYASPVRWGGEGWSSKGVNATAYIQDSQYAGGNRFLVWDGDTGDDEFAGFIAQGNAFWIRAVNDDAELIVTEAAKTKYDNAAVLKTKEDQSRATLVVALQHHGWVDKTYVKFGPGYNDHFEPAVDALKKENDYFNLSTMSDDLVPLAINAVSADFCTKTIALSVTSTKPGEYSLTFTGTSFNHSLFEKAYLRDNYVDATVEIEENGRYVFSVDDEPSSQGNNRFALILENALATPVIAVDGNALMSSYQTGNQWLFNGDEIAGATEPTLLAMQTGSYQVKVIQGNCHKLSDPYAVTVTGVTPGRALEFSIYPNPVEQEFVIGGLPVGKGSLHYTILSTTGVTVQQGEMILSDNTPAKIKIGDPITHGVYILKLQGSQIYRPIKLLVKK